MKDFDGVSTSFWWRFVKDLLWYLHVQRQSSWRITISFPSIFIVFDQCVVPHLEFLVSSIFTAPWSMKWTKKRSISKRRQPNKKFNMHLVSSDPLSSSHGLQPIVSWQLCIPFDWEGTWWDEENLTLERMTRNDRWVYSGLLDNKLGLYSTDNLNVGWSYWLILERNVNGTLKGDVGYQRMFVSSFGQGNANTGYQGRGGKLALIFPKFREFVESGVW